jgi:NADP-dependent 3-hydroxy acid dehydrogenase YdfG
MAQMEQDLSGGVLVVTGAGSGIGEGVARYGAANGMPVVLADIAEERIASVAAEIVAAGGQALSVVTDVRDAAAVQRLAARAYETFGAVRLLVNNAGIESTGFIWDVPPERWKALWDINVGGVYHGVRAFVPRMIEAGTPASIVNLASIGAITSGPMQAAYIASKHAVQALTECLLFEVEAAGAPISVHTVNPGPVSTRIFTDAIAEGESGAAPKTEMERYLSEHGLTPAGAAEAIFEHVTRGDFWIVTHPEMQQAAAERRARMLVERTRPVLMTT